MGDLRHSSLLVTGASRQLLGQGPGQSLLGTPGPRQLPQLGLEEIQPQIPGPDTSWPSLPLRQYPPSDPKSPPRIFSPGWLKVSIRVCSLDPGVLIKMD